MRSRYTAYCLGNVDYLFNTHHPARRTPNERAELAKTARTTQWRSLIVLNAQKGQPTDDTGVVEFVAVYADPNPGQLHERSRFARKRDRWFYVDGDLLPPLTPKRSEPCWCGSGKKFKLCHG